MSDANRTAVGIVEEVTPGTTPATPLIENLRIKSHSLKYAKQTVISNELVADRQILDVIPVGFEAGGDVPMETSFGALDTPFRANALSEWIFAAVRSNELGVTNITAVSATAYTVLTTGATKGNSGLPAVGMLFRAAGFGAVGNNRLFRAAATTSATSIVMTAGTIEASPPVGARLKAVGFEGASGDITATSTGLASTALDFTTMGLGIGEWLWVGGGAVGQQFADPDNKGFVRISGPVTATAIPLDNLPVGWGVDAGTGKTIRCFFGDYIRNGVTKRSHSLEVQYQDLAPVLYDVHTGMVSASLAVSLQARAIVEVTQTWMGLNTTTGSTRIAGATDKAAPTFDIMNSSSNVGQLYENGLAVTGPNFVVGVTLTMANNLRRRNAVGSSGSVAIALGRVAVDGTMSTYFGDNTVRQKVLSSVASSFMTAIVDPAGPRGYLLDFPKIKFIEGDPSTPGVDQDRMLDAKFQAVKHPTFGYTYHIQRFEEYGT